MLDHWVPAFAGTMKEVFLNRLRIVSIDDFTVPDLYLLLFIALPRFFRKISFHR